jgi:hypothetical protein
MLTRRWRTLGVGGGDCTRQSFTSAKVQILLYQYKSTNTDAEVAYYKLQGVGIVPDKASNDPKP